VFDWGSVPAPSPGASLGPADAGQHLSSAPLHWLGLGIVAGLVGLTIPLVTSSAKLSVAGWLIAGILPALTLAVFIHRDMERRAAGWARAAKSAAPLRIVLVLVAAAAVATNAWVIADAVARRQW
jgi:hypothetical protein